MFKTDSFLGNKKLSLNQNVWRDHATMQQDVLLHFWVIFLYLKSCRNIKKIFCCPALELFCCLPLWKTVLFVSSRAFSLSIPTFLLSTPVENSEATWKKAIKCNKILQSSIPVNCYYVVDLLMAYLELFHLLQACRILSFELRFFFFCRELKTWNNLLKNSKTNYGLYNQANTLKEMNDVYNVLTGIVIQSGPGWEISVFLHILLKTHFILREVGKFQK